MCGSKGTKYVQKEPQSRMGRPNDPGDLLREAAPRVLAALVRRFGDFSESEDAVQEAMIDAARQWPAQGTPESPVGWLVHVASRRMTDRIRSDSARRGREEKIAADRAEPPAGAEHDDTLVLMLMCCHSALAPASAIALTLRAVGGLTAAGGNRRGAFPCQTRRKCAPR
jgi:predicted RNA polymerase sigma factor